MIRSGSEIIEVRSKRLARAGDALVDLFDGSHTLRAIAQQTGVPLQELERLTRRLSRLHQLETGPASDRVQKQRSPALRIRSSPRHAGGLHSLLLVGLGELGLTVLDQLLHYGPQVVHIFDPVPVENGDLAPFYRPGDLGRMKADVVWRCLGGVGQNIVRRVKSEGGERQTIEAALRQVAGKVQVVLSCVDRASQLAECVSAVCETARVPLVVAELLDAGGSVGPIRTPDGARESGGCVSCASLYRAEGDPFLLLEREYLRRRFPLPVRRRPAAEAWLIEMISRLALLAAFQAGDRASNPVTSQSMLWQLSGEPFEVISTSVPRHYACRQCFPAPERTSSELRKQALRDWKRNWNGPATEPVDLLELRRRSQHLVGERFAVFRSCAQESADQRSAVYRFCRDRGADPQDNLVANAFRAVVERPGYGSDRTMAFSQGSDFHDGRKAEALALMEAIERLFALEHCDPRRVVAASYKAVARCALDPTTFPLYAAEQYAQRGFGLRKFDPGQCIEWIWGIRISDSKAVLVPLDLVFGRRGPRLYRANSNGAACHSSFHHAVLGGIYETIERDSLMVVWMNRLSLPVLSSSIAAANIVRVRRDFEALFLELTCVDITTDLDIPVMLGVLTDKLNPDFLLVNPVASLSQELLNRKLGREMTQFCRPYLSDCRCYTNRVSANSDPESVKSLPDHLMFYQNREKIRHARFLTSGPNQKDGMHAAGAREPSEVQAELSLIVERLSRRGYQVIVVDCSVPMIRDLGLHLVKVLIPGLQPLHAGHRYAALGGERLYRVPRLMGLARRDRSRDELNPWPHPFW